MKKLEENEAQAKNRFKKKINEHNINILFATQYLIDANSGELLNVSNKISFNHILDFFLF